MKDRSAILIVATVVALVHQFATEFKEFEYEWTYPLITLLLLTLVLTKIQQQKNNTFPKHFLKGLKIGFLFLLAYIPLCLLFSLRWTGAIDDSLNNLLGKTPVMIASVITKGVILLPQIIIASLSSFVLANREFYSTSN